MRIDQNLILKVFVYLYVVEFYPKNHLEGYHCYSICKH